MKRYYLLMILLFLIGTEKAFCTTDTICSPPSGLHVSNVTATSFTLVWDGSDSTTSYLISLLDSNNMVSIRLATTQDTSILLSGLQAGNTYNMAVQRICGNSDTSSISNLLVSTILNDTCQYSIEMTDTYGDGWNNASLSLYTEDSVLIRTFWFEDYVWGTESGYSKTEYFSCDGRVVRLLWTRGYYDGECGFTIKDAAGNPIITGIGEWYPAGTDWQNATNILFKIYNVRGQLIHNALIDYYGYYGGSFPPIEIFSIPFPCLADSNAINHVYYSSSEHGTVSVTSSTMSLFNGQMVGDSATVTIYATPANNYTLNQITIRMGNDTIVATTSPYSLTVTSDVYIHASFVSSLPDLHVTSIQNSIPIAGESMDVEWTVRNDGYGSTPQGVVWLDRIYIVSDVDVDIQDPVVMHGFLGSYPNLQSLSVGQSYTNSATVNIPIDLYGNYFLFVLSDQVDASSIDFSALGGIAPIPYAPSLSGTPYPYLHGYSHEGDTIEELEENDNFFYKMITIQPPPSPDLTVTHVSHPIDAFSNTDIPVSWTVTNQGQVDAIGSWCDKVYIQTTESNSLMNAYLLTTITRTDSLPVGGSYQVSTTVHIPISYMGDYYIVVVTDVNDDIYESIFENNNITCSDRSISVVMSPLSDLIVSDLIMEDSVSANAIRAIQWTCSNGGLAATETNRWYDAIYFSEDTVLNVYSDRKVESILHRGTLNIDSSYHVSASVRIPNLVSGWYYVFVKVDETESIYEYLNEQNNVIRRQQPIFIMQPDFFATSVTIPDTGWSGRGIQALVTIQNIGEALYQGGIPVRIWIKNNQDSCELFSGSVTVNIPKHDSTLIVQNLSIPQGISGDYFCHVNIGQVSAITELSYSNNHAVSVNPLHINLSPYPDLVVSNIDIPDTVNTGQSIQINYNIVNQGNVLTDGYNSSQILFCRIPDGICYSISSSDYQRIVIEPDSQAFYYQTGIVPSSIPAGSYNVYIKVDANDVFYEYNGENNNTSHGGVCVVNVYPQDLELLQIDGPDTVRWGQAAQYKLRVKNNSLVPTQQDRWNDKLKLMLGNTEPSISSSHQGILQPDSVYENRISIVVPYGTPPSAIVEATVDDDYVNPDINRSNNQLSKNIVIRPVPTPDLVVTNVEVLDDPISGQPMRIAYEATNIGQDSIVDKSWTDALFLSRNQSHDSLGAEVKTKSQRRSLRVGESYRDTITDVQVSLPNQGAFFVMVSANKNKNFFESRWDNNIAHRFINVVLPPPGDLIVGNITQPDTVISGNNINATWSILNVGVDSIRGRGLSTLVYLSQDTSFDVNDKRIGVVENDYTALAPNDSIVQTFSGRLSGIAEGDYHLIVKTDVRNVFYEDSDDNNDAVGINTVHIKVKELLFDSLLSDSLYNNLPNDYVLRTREYRNETARIQVTSPDSSLGTRNTLYVKHNGVGSNLNYTYSSIAQNTNSPYVYIPHTRDSLYYVSVYGVSAAGRQYVSLEANILSFELNEINPTEGGDNGNITLELLGSHFRPDMKVFLTKNTDTIYASKLFYNSYYQVFARFTFNHIDTGYYDVGVLNYCEGENMLAHAFHVTDNSLENISYNMIYPASPRSNRTISMVLEFGNIGNMDIVSPIIEITSAGGSYIALSADELSEKKQVLQIPLNIEGEPEGVLRPGKIGQITIYGYTTGQLLFLINRVK